MLRRKWLEFVLGAASAGIVTRDWLVSLAQGAEVPEPQDATPTTVAGAIKTQRAASIASFVLTYPILANAASIQEKGTMVQLLGNPLVGDVWNKPVMATEQERYERAALTILRSLERRPSDMEAVLKIAGGQEALQRALPLMRITELKTLSQSYVKP